MPLQLPAAGFRRNAAPAVLYTMHVQNGRPIAEWVSENITQVAGYAPDDVKEPGWWTEHIHPEDRKVESEADRELLDIGYMSYEYRFRFADGRYRWIRDEMRVVDDDSGNRMIFGVWRDITPFYEAQKALLAGDKLLKKLTQHVPGVLYQFELTPDGTMRFPYASEGIRDIYGVSPDQAASDALIVRDAIHPDDFQEVLDSISRSAETMSVWKTEYRVKPDGYKYRWIRGEASPEKQDDGTIIWYGYIMDITAEKQTERKLKLAANVFEYSHDSVMITDAESRIVKVNPGFERITGYRNEEVLGEMPSILSSGKHDQSFYKTMWQSLETRQHWQGEIWNKTKDGQLYCERKTISTVVNADGDPEYYIGIGTDVTHEKRQQQRMEQLAHFDQLTELPNRTLLNDRIQMAVESAKRNHSGVTVLFLDLDDFKPINDSYGHSVGDQLLREIASKLTANVRSSDTVARLGGDEFVIVLGQESAAHYEDLTNRLIKVVGQSVNLHGQVLQVTPSIGIAHYPSDAEEADSLIRCADQAMYEAKRRGRNCAVRFAELND